MNEQHNFIEEHLILLLGKQMSDILLRQFSEDCFEKTITMMFKRDHKNRITEWNIKIIKED